MSQVNITVDYEEVVALFSKERNEAFAYLMERILNAFLLAESEEQVGAGMQEKQESNGLQKRNLGTSPGNLDLENQLKLRS